MSSKKAAVKCGGFVAGITDTFCEMRDKEEEADLDRDELSQFRFAEVHEGEKQGTH